MLLLLIKYFLQLLLQRVAALILCDRIGNTQKNGKVKYKLFEALLITCCLLVKSLHSNDRIGIYLYKLGPITFYEMFNLKQ